MALILVWFGIVSCGFGWIYGVSVDISPGEKKLRPFQLQRWWSAEVFIVRTQYAYALWLSNAVAAPVGFVVNSG